MLDNKKKHFIVLGLFAAVAAFVSFYSIERQAQTSTLTPSLIPKDFGSWHMTMQNDNIGAYESTFLDFVMTRSYKRLTDGKTITLTIAYGGDQRKPFSLHFPEDCYKAAGYIVTSYGYEVMNVPHISLKKLMAKNITVEPMFYWIIFDGKVITSQFEMLFKRLYYGFKKSLNSGILVRVSSVATEQDFQKDYAMQKEFIGELYNALPLELKKHLFGSNND